MPAGSHERPPLESVILSAAKNPRISPASALPLDAHDRLRAACERFAALPLSLQYLLLFTAVVFGHLTLLRLPYFWDEAGYYIPAALDFFHRGTLIPEYTNAHPPLPNIVLGTVWRLTGFHILATRLTACAFAAAALLAVCRLTTRLLNPVAAAAVTFLTALYPIWYTQSSLAHADIFATAFTLAALALYLPASQSAKPHKRLHSAVLFSLAALSKETAIVWPASLAALELLRTLREEAPQQRREHARWFGAFCAPVFPLLAWFAYHRYKTGFTFGNPEYLRYNAIANFTVAHIFQAFRYRFLHIFTQRAMWLPLLLAAACFLLTRRTQDAAPERRLPLRAEVLRTIAFLVATNWLFFSVLGGALLTRYLLPVYPLLLLLSVAMWQAYTRAWPWLVLLTAAAFVSGWWFSPPTSFAPEDCLVYRDMIVVHQEAIRYIAEHSPQATVLTAWPAAAELTRPDLGYTDHPMKVTSIDNFTPGEVAKAAAEPAAYDLALVITTRYTQPSLRRWLLTHPHSRRGRAYTADRELSPEEVARALGGTILFRDDRDGEWAAVLRFPRS